MYCIDINTPSTLDPSGFCLSYHCPCLVFVLTCLCHVFYHCLVSSFSFTSSFSSSEEGKAIRELKKRMAGSEKERKQKKIRKNSTSDSFRRDVYSSEKVSLVDVDCRGTSGRRRCKCILCGITKNNKIDLWKDHARKCRGVIHHSEKSRMGNFLGIGGELHRKTLVDNLCLAYYVYKERLPFTTGDRMNKVLPPSFSALTTFQCDLYCFLVSWLDLKTPALCKSKCTGQAQSFTNVLKKERRFNCKIF